ncbi:MAG: HAMP domain-containing histidine kinase [Labilithrix sp.]|nr:HAMP domain-containing histidine kinase [Labilithrix sp.]MCW5813038.1 HAMP domain-containing histidine kinase [Labilithrix sp.]
MKRQLTRLGIAGDGREPPSAEQWSAFVEAMNARFVEVDEERRAVGHRQKLEEVGRLAAGIAHEINTPVQFVSDNVHFLQSSFETVTDLVTRLVALASSEDAAREAVADADWGYLGDEIPCAIKQTLEGLTRVASIVRSMKNFAHNDRGEATETDLNAVLRTTLTVAGHELKSIAHTVEDFGDIPRVVCCRGELSQVFLNLIVNAAHATADVVKRTGVLGRIAVSTALDGDHVVVAVSDTGGGIPDHAQGHIFEPFFTTKDPGRGTGQGLALAFGVVKKHGGTLRFETEQGAGTTFFVRLPIAGAPSSSVRAA